MGYPVDRIQLYNQNGVPLPELYPNEVESRVRHEEINGEHTLTIVTKRKLDVGWRAVTVDGMGKWREWVVEQADELHEAGINAVGTYRMVWSLQYDLSYTFDDSGDLGHREIGIAHTATGREAVEAAIAGSAKWTVSAASDVPAIAVGGGVVMIAESAWDRLSKVVAAWGGEIDAQITVGATSIEKREILFMTHLGKYLPTRRFEWGEDLTSIQRTPDPGPYFCRVVPIGRGTTEYAEGPAGTDPTEDNPEFEWPLSLLDDPEYDPHPHEWIEDADVVEAFRVFDGNGGWEYPTKVVKYDEEDVQLLYEAAMKDLHNHTRPNITYEASVAQFARAGFDAKGVALGDEIQVVDRGFNPGSELRIQERVTSIDIDELDDDRTELVIGKAQESLADTIASMNTDFDEAVERLSYYTTPQYVRDLIGRLNDEINRSGGYTYLVPGRGQVTYDVAVSDPNVGEEATKAVEIRGGSIRIGSRTGSAGEWEWNSIFVDGHIAAELVTAAHLTTGTIGSAASGNYWDLDTGMLRMAANTPIGDDTTLEDVVIAVDIQFAESTSSTEPPGSDAIWSSNPPAWREGHYIWQKTVSITNSGTSEKEPVCISGRDGRSFNNATLFIYKRSASEPTVPSTTLTYSFDGGTLSGDMDGWSTTIPDGDQPCWMSSSVASSTSDQDTILTNEWSSPPVKIFQTGQNGTSNAIVMLYRRSATAPKPPTGTFTYTFSDGKLNGTLGGWSQAIPDGELPCWVIAATAITDTGTATIRDSDFSSPVKFVENGTSGEHGVNTAVVYLYKRSTTQPIKPTISYKYTFETKALATTGSGQANGWTPIIPDGSEPCWVIAGTAASAQVYDVIKGSQFSDPVILAENGLNGLNQATIYLYQRSSSTPQVPSTTMSYTFKDGKLPSNIPNGWSRTIPSGSKPCWVTSAVAISSDATDDITKNDWSEPTILAENGADGTKVCTVYLYARSEEKPDKPSVSFVYYFSTGKLVTIPTSGGTMGKWSQNLPTGRTPCWITSATASSTDDSDTIEGSQFSEPVKLAENGVDGLSQAVVRLYQRSPSKPNAPSSTLTYTFESGELSGEMTNGWSTNLTFGADPCWTTNAVAISTGATDVIDGSDWSEPVKLVVNGADGVNTATLLIYTRSKTQPTTPSGNVTYTFREKQLTGLPSEWSVEIPAGEDPCWVTSAVAASSEDSDTIAPGEWSDAQKMVENGLNRATVYLYRRGETPDNNRPSMELFYNFENGFIRNIDVRHPDDMDGWSRSIPSGTEPCWVISAAAVSAESTTTIASTRWSSPARAFANGLNSATVSLYRRAPEKPSSDAMPNDDVTYTFANGTVTGSGRNGWTQEMPSGTSPCWVITATAVSYEKTDVISASEWSTPRKFSENGLNQATVFLYRSYASQPSGDAAHPTGETTYTFSTHALSGNLNYWTQTVPNTTSTIWVICATAVSSAATDKIPESEWTTPVMMTGQDGSDGVGIRTIIEQYCVLPEGSEPTSTTQWYDSQQVPEDGKSIWTRSKIIWEDDNITYTDPVLAEAINGAYRAITELDKSFDAKKVFDRLTNKGKIQGIYTDDTGNYYINATYIGTGTLASSNGLSYFKLNTGEMRMVSAGYSNGYYNFASLGSATAYNSDGEQTTVRGFHIDHNTSDGLYGHRGMISIAGTDGTSEPEEYYDSNGEYVTTGNSYRTASCITSRGTMYLCGLQSKANAMRPIIKLGAGSIWAAMLAHNGTDNTYVELKNGSLRYSVKANNSLSISILGRQTYSVGTANSGSGTWNYVRNGGYPDAIRERTWFITEGVHAGYIVGKGGYLSGTLEVDGNTNLQGGLTVTGTKSRVVDTDTYGDRLLYCYETSSPMFGDVGSGTIDETGVCVVSIDDILSETMRTDMAYQVFLQKCGEGDLWVSEKSSMYFVVRGTPGLDFDWEVKARQVGYEYERLEQTVPVTPDEVNDNARDVLSDMLELDYNDSTYVPDNVYVDDLVLLSDETPREMYVEEYKMIDWR